MTFLKKTSLIKKGKILRIWSSFWLNKYKISRLKSVSSSAKEDISTLWLLPTRKISPDSLLCALNKLVCWILIEIYDLYNQLKDRVNKAIAATAAIISWNCLLWSRDSSSLFGRLPPFSQVFHSSHAVLSLSSDINLLSAFFFFWIYFYLCWSCFAFYLASCFLLFS